MKMKYLEVNEDDNGGMGWVTGNAPDARAQVTAAVFSTDGKIYDASDHVEEQCDA